jgi:hypothetical protein
MAIREKTNPHRTTIAIAAGVVGLTALEAAGRAVLHAAAGEIFSAFFFAVCAIGGGWLAAETWQARR